MSNLPSACASTTDDLPARPSGPLVNASSRFAKSGPKRRAGDPAVATAAAAPGPRDDGGSGRAFFPVPEANSGDGGLATELSEAEKYLLSVRQQHAALPAFTKVLNPYSRSVTPVGSGSASAGMRTPLESTTGVATSSSIARALSSDSKTTSRHLFQPTESWRKTFLDHFLDLRANLVHDETQPEPALTAHRIPQRYLPIPKNGDYRGWRQYMIGAKRRRLNGGNSDELLATAPVAPRATPFHTDVMVLDGADATMTSTEAAAISAGDTDRESSMMLDTRVPTVLAQDADVVQHYDEEEEVMNGCFDADDEEAAINDGVDYKDESEEYETPMTAEEAFDAFEFGDWYDPTGEDGADGAPGGAARNEATANDDNDDDGWDDDEPSGAEVDEAELELLEDRHVGREPSLSLIQGFSDKTTLAVLKHITTLIETTPGTPFLAPGLARWAFALLAHLDPTTGLLTGEQTSHLRSLARACLAIVEAHAEALIADGDRARWLGSAKVEERMGCWMIWVAVIGVWAQRDLEDEMTQVLARNPIV